MVRWCVAAMLVLMSAGCHKSPSATAVPATTASATTAPATTPPATTAPARPRIVSFSPALTRMLFDLGLGAQVVGVTSQDSLPPGQACPVVGDAFSVNTEAVLAVKPDIILTQVDPSAFEAVARIDPHVRIEPVRIETLDDLGAAMRRVGELAGNASTGEAAAVEFQHRLDQVRQSVAGLERPNVAFITDFDLLGSAGAGTFIDQLIDVAGGLNVAAKYSGWVTLTLEALVAAGPQVVICQASPAQAQRVREFWARQTEIPAVRQGRVFVVTDRQWTIPTARLADFAAQMARMFHPELEASTRGP
jgi:iron complex transport system substrate-binding protein